MLPAIEVKQVCKHFGNLRVLTDIDLEIHTGEFFALLGPNGAGKTTLISIIAGLSLANNGSVHVMGYDVRTQYQQARRNLGVVPQELVFDPFFTVREILLIQSGYYGIKENTRWVDEIIERLDLTDKASANMRALSGGMKRRVLVAQALVHKPPVIILDEPTAGVDVELRQTLWDFIKQLNQDGHTIVLTTHYLEEAEQCNNLGFMVAGEVVAEGTPTGIKAEQSGHLIELITDKPQHASNFLKGKMDRWRVSLFGDRLNVITEEDVQTGIKNLKESLEDVGIMVLRAAEETFSLEDVFISIVEKQRQN